MSADDGNKISALTRRKRRLRPYHPSRLYSSAEPPAEWREAANTLRAQLVAARGGQDEVTVQEGVLIDLIIGTAMKVQRANVYLATLPSLVDRRHRRLWPIVLDVKRLERHLANLLRDLGLERKPKTVPDIRQLAGLVD
jgi:hypothetical protein